MAEEVQAGQTDQAESTANNDTTNSEEKTTVEAPDYDTLIAELQKENETLKEKYEKETAQAAETLKTLNEKYKAASLERAQYRQMVSSYVQKGIDVDNERQYVNGFTFDDEKGEVTGEGFYRKPIIHRIAPRNNPPQTNQNSNTQDNPRERGLPAVHNNPNAP